MKTLIRNPGLALILTIGLFFLVLGVSLADTPKSENPQALHTIPTLTGSIYKAGADTGNVGDTVKIPIYFGSAGYNVSEEFLMYWTWKADSLTFLYTQTSGYNWPSNWTLTITQQNSDTLKIRGAQSTGQPFIADSTSAIFALAFKVACVADSGGKTKVHWEPDIEANHHSHFHTSALGDQQPQYRRDSLVWNSLVDSCEVDTEHDTTIIDDTAKVKLTYWTNFKPVGGCSLRVEFDSTKLQYIGLDTVGTAMAGKTIYVDGAGAGKRVIRTTDALAKGTYNTLVKVKLKNIMTQNHQAGAVWVPYAKFRGCNAAFAEQTQQMNTGFVTTHYKATADLEEETTPQNTNDSLEVYLTNNFKVLMTNDANPYYASTRIDTNWTYMTFKNIKDRDSKNYHWQYSPVDLGKRIREHQTTNSSTIQKTAVPDTIYRVAYLTNSTQGVTQPVKFRADQFGQSLYKEDCRLTDSVRSSIQIFSVANDSDLYLVNGSVTIPSPPGGSCPFLYVWNGNQFLEDNDILTTSEFTATSTPITDYYKVSQPLVEQNGQYLLQLREVENEESYIDEAALVAVDHPRSVKVGVTPEGKILAYDKSLFPIACIDQDGKDQLDKILSRDELYFESDGPGYLLLTFNNSTSKELRDIRAEGAPDDGIDKPPQKRIGTFTVLTVEIEDSDGQWHNLGVVAPRANVQSAFWVLGTTDIPLGEQFRVKLSWDKFYSVDRLAYYAPTDKPWYQESLRLTQAGHSKKMDVTSQVSAYDGNSAKLIPGEIINMSFPAAKPVPDGMVRDFIFKAVGYYIPYNRASTGGPFTYKLHSNYPNPFNAQTEIQYALPEPSEVNLSVYNIMGQKVKTLVEGRQSAGVHRVIWDGKNEKGETVASGVYFYTIRAGIYMETKKMTLLK